jgi:spermidine/putrescine transport system ATP-binding protein
LDCPNVLEGLHLISSVNNGHENPEYDLECCQVSKTFGSFVAVDKVSFQLPKGSFFSILGPSGCGKTTLLRMLAGFEQPDEGDILINGSSVLGQPPNQRPVNMVFQHLALFPTMNVADNIAYGLQRRKVVSQEIALRVADVLERIGLPDAGSKRINQLSGGQKQRIAIARCLVLNPAVLLLDEPLGALDLKLREQMKVELKNLQAEFGTTFIYITHDQSEALVMSDQLAVMIQGRFEQVGSPQDLYYSPRTAFVASFVGDSNQWSGKVVCKDSLGYQIITDSGQQLKSGLMSNQVFSVGDLVTVYVRPEAISLNNGKAEADQHNHFRGQVKNVLFDGARSQLRVAFYNSPERLSVAMPQTGEYSMIRVGDLVHLSWSRDNSRVFLNV